MTEPTIAEFYLMDDEALKNNFTKEQLEELANDMIWLVTDLVCSRFDNLGVSMSRTGGIGSYGFRCWLSRNGQPSKES